MSQHKLTSDLLSLFASIIKSPSPQTTQDLLTFSNRILNSLLGSQSPQPTQVIKQKCLQRASSIYNNDSKTTLKCQDLIHRISNSRSLNEKGASIKVLLKLSEAQNLSSSTVSLESNFMQSQMSKKHQMDMTANTFRQEDLRREKTMPEKLAIIRMRGSPEQSASENEILRELIFAMQNIQGNLLQYSGDIPAILKPFINVSEPVRKIVTEIAEIGWLYKKITTKSFDIGEVIESFSLAVENELSQFYRWVAIIEGMLLENQLSLRKLVMWSMQPLERMKWLAILSQAVFPFRGTQIISIINSYRPHGNIHLMELFNRLLLEIIQPLFKFIRLWVCRGELFDPYTQFFIKEEPKMGSENFWQRKYTLIEENVPNIMGMENARIVFNIGKTINFLRHCCGEQFQLKIDFLSKQSILDSKCTAITFSFEFTEWLNECEKIVNGELMRVLFTKFKLKKHLDAVKRFLLMGQGDFIDELLDILGQELNKTPTHIYKHNLNNLLEKALASSNAQYLDEDITGRVNVEMLQGPDGWDNFILTYYVDEPINTLLTPRIMKQGYLGIFGFLWKLKRVERAVNMIWTNHIKEISRKTTTKNESKSETANKTKRYSKKFQRLFIECSLLRSSMQHFISSLYSYIILKIEAAWGKFNEALETTTRFDEVIKLHEELVIELREICFLEPKTKNIQSALFALFQHIFNFKHRQDSLIESYHNFKEVVREAMLSERAVMRLEKLDMRQEVNIPLGFNETYTKDLLNDGSKKIYQAREYFVKVLTELMVMLEKEGDKYSVLSLKQDFNEFYKLMVVAKYANKR